MSRKYYLKKGDNFDEELEMKIIEKQGKFNVPVTIDFDLLADPKFNFQLYMFMLSLSNRRSGGDIRYLKLIKFYQYFEIVNMKVNKLDKKTLECMKNSHDYITTYYKEELDIPRMFFQFEKIDGKYTLVSSEQINKLKWKQDSRIRIFLFLKYSCRNGERVIYRETIAKKCGIKDYNTIADSIKELEKEDYITVTRKYDLELKKTINAYKINDGYD